MRTVYAQKNKKIILGRQGEDKAVRVVWPGIVSEWSSLYGDGSFQLSVRRFGDENAYPVVVEVNGDDIRFTVTSAETAIAGNGRCELTYIANGSIAKSATWETVVLNSLTGQTPSEPPEEPAKSWFTAIQGQIGNLANLQTTSKDNLVDAINEAAQSGGGSGGGGGGGVQSDWNQNDDTQPDYVKNRPFYNETETVTVENDGGEELNYFPVFAVGDTVTVNVDGVEHSLVAYDDQGYATIGDTTNSIDNGEGQLGWQIYFDPKYNGVWFYAKEAHTVSYLGVVGHHKIDSKYLPDNPLNITGAAVGQIAKITAVDDTGKPTAWEAADMPSGGGGTKMEEVTETVTVGSENVTLDSTAPSQTVNLAWNVPGGKTIPPFTNYYIQKDNISYPRTFNAAAYTQVWSVAAGHGNDATFVSGHQYFQAMYYRMDGDGSAVIMSGGLESYITPTNSMTVTGSGWIYLLLNPSNSSQVSAGFKNSGSGTGTIDYLYCIDVTALQEAGTITATTVNELAELFGGLELIPGQDYAGSVTSGMATLSITRDGETTTVDSGTDTATVQGGDILSVEGGSVTFLLKVLREVYVDPIKVWEGKKWVAFGDSLTDETINADKKYYRYIEEKTGITVVVMGAGGTGYYKGYDSGMAYGQRMANVPADADVITIFGSVNDWQTKNAGVAMGNASDTMEAGTLAGYINECIDVAIEKAPYAQIALVTPMDYKGLPSDTLEGIANIIKAVAAYRQIKCLDLYHESGFRVRNPIFAAVYTTDYNETAESYGHPSNLAHEQLIAPEFMELLKRMLLTA